MAKKIASFNVIFHYPKYQAGKRELAKRVADAHARMVNQYINNLDCPSYQKIQLFDAVITLTKKK